MIRNCPKCNNEIKYKNKYYIEKANRNNSVCKKCMLKNKSQKKLYGNKYDEIINKRSESLRKVKHTSKWHLKIAESRRLNGSYNISEKTRNKLKESSYFKGKSGSQHPGIKKLLKNRNITYEQYLESLTDYRKYYKKVRSITDKQLLHTLRGYEKRGRCGVVGAYNLDHIIEIYEGFEKNISPEIIGYISNLRFIPWKENINKRYNTGLPKTII